MSYLGSRTAWSKADLEKQNLLQDMLFCYEYLQFEFKGPHVLDFGLKGMEINCVPSRGNLGNPFYIGFSGHKNSCLEWLFSKYVLVFKYNIKTPAMRFVNSKIERNP